MFACEHTTSCACTLTSCACTLDAALLAAALVAMAHYLGAKHDCRIRAMWDAPTHKSPWLHECNAGPRDSDPANDQICYCYQYPMSAPGQPNHDWKYQGQTGREYFPNLENACWKDRAARRGYEICSW